jgi:hypothetical protein
MLCRPRALTRFAQLRCTAITDPLYLTLWFVCRDRVLCKLTIAPGSLVSLYVLSFDEGWRTLRQVACAGQESEWPK